MTFLKYIRNNAIRTSHQRTRWALYGEMSFMQLFKCIPFCSIFSDNIYTYLLCCKLLFSGSYILCCLNIIYYRNS